jgi:hypothetical protein
VRRDAAAGDVLLALLLLVTVGLLVVSALSFPNPSRPDHVVYGRYVEVVAPPLLAVALARLAGRWAPPPVAAAAVALLVLTAAVAVLRRGLTLHALPILVNVSALPFGLGPLGARAITGAGVVAAAAVVVLSIAGRRLPWAVAPLLLVFFLPTSARAARSLLRNDQYAYRGEWSSPGDALAGRQVPVVGYDEDRDVFYGGTLYPYFLTTSVLRRFSSQAQAPPSQYVMSAADWPRAHADRPAVPIWRDSARDQVLWRLTVDPLDAVRVVERCLAGAGLTARRADPSSGATQVIVATPGGAARIDFLATPAVATLRAAGIERFARAPGGGATVAVFHRGTAVATVPVSVDPRARRAVERCV